MNYFEQKSSEKVAYKQTVSGDAISSAAWAISPAGPTVTKTSETSTETVALVYGLTDNNEYELAVTITTTTGQIFKRIAKIRCVD